MSRYLGLLIVFGFFAIGDFLGVKTKAKLSSVFVALMLFLVLFMTGIIPPDIIEIAGLTEISKISLGFLVFNMGTKVSLSQMKKDWRVVVMSMLGMVVAMGAIFLTIPIIGKEAAIVTIPIVNGGLAATQIMTDAAMTAGFATAAALGTLVFAVQKFVGTVPASRAGLKEAKLVSEEYRANKEAGITIELESDEYSGTGEKTFYQKHKKYFTTYITLGITAAVLFVGNILAEKTGVSISIWALLAGMTLKQFDLVPNGILDHGKSSGLWMVASFASLIPSLAKITFSQFTELAFQTGVVFAAVLIGIYVVFYLLPTWKVVGSKNLAIGIATSQLLGFPATFLIVNEVATAVAETEEEKSYIVEKLSPAFVVSGFVSVTTISILIAGIFANFI